MPRYESTAKARKKARAGGAAKARKKAAPAKASKKTAARKKTAAAKARKKAAPAKARKTAAPAKARKKAAPVRASKKTAPARASKKAAPARASKKTATASNKAAVGGGGDKARLEAAIAADPDDLGAWSVYGDFLQAAGDPRGELIAIQVALTDKPRNAKLKKKEAELLYEHSEDWLGDLAISSDFACTWRNGFLDSVTIGNVDDESDEADGEADGAEYFKELMKTGSARFLRELTIGLCDITDDDTFEPYDDMVRTMASVGLPETLRKLVFTCSEREISWTSLGDLGPLFPQLGELETLEIKMGSIGLGKMKLPSLKRLEVVTGGFTKENMKAVSEAEWPELETLILYFGDYRANCTVEDLAAVLDGRNFPKLKHLGLCNAAFADDIAKALPESRILKQIETLDLSHGWMFDKGFEALLAGAGAFRHLASLVLPKNAISDALADKLQKLARKVDLSDMGAWFRSMEVGE